MKKYIGNDEYGRFGAQPYIYRNGKRWFLLWWTTSKKAQENCPDGWTVNRYNGEVEE